MKTKKIPAIIMLIGGSVTCIVTYISRYDLEEMLIALVVSLIIFYILGLLVEFLFEKFEIAKEEDEIAEEDGEVVEKTGETSEEEEGTAAEEETE